MRDSFRFAHRLTADAAYKALLGANRRLLHNSAADALAPRIVAGTVDEVALRQRLLEHLLASERWLEAHECACRLLDRYATTAWIEHWGEHRAVAEHAWRAATPGTAPVEEESASFAYALSSLAELRGESEETARLCQLALRQALEQGQPATAAWALERLSSWHFNSGRVTESEALRDEGLRLARQSGDWLAEARILDGIGNQLLYKSHFDEAWELMGRARRIYQEHGNVRLEAALLMNWASGKRMQGHFAEAQKIRLRALQLARECADRRLEAWLLGNIANYLGHSGDIEGALSQVQQAISLLKEMGDRAAAAQFTTNLGIFYSQAGDSARAEEQMRFALADQRQLGDLHLMAITLANLGSMHRQLENLATGCAELEEAAEIFETYADMAWLGWTRMELGRSQVAAGQPAAAALSFAAAAAALRMGGEPQDLLETLTEWLELQLEHPGVQDGDSPAPCELLEAARAEALRSESSAAGKWLRRLEQLEVRLAAEG